MHPHYYRAKAAALAWQIAQAEIASRLTAARQAFAREMEACDLDPQRTYRLADDTQDIVPDDAACEAH